MFAISTSALTLTIIKPHRQSHSNTPHHTAYPHNLTTALSRPHVSSVHPPSIAMAVTLKRKRGAVSYKEPSSDISDEEVSTDSDQQQQPRTKRAAPQRRSVRSRQSAQPSPRRPHPQTSRAHRVQTEDSIKLRGRANISYRDLSTDEEESDGDFEVEVVAAAPRAPRIKTKTDPLPRIRREKKSRGRARKALGAPMKRRPSE
jgi:hypothetical protein